jgi:hypothetical protein
MRPTTSTRVMVAQAVGIVLFAMWILIITVRI